MRFQKQRAADVDLGPAEDVGEHRPAGRERPVGDRRPRRRARSAATQQGRAAAPADPEEAEARRVAIGPRPEVGEGRLEVADLVVGHPLERLVDRVDSLCAVVPEVEGEEVEAEVAEVVGVGQKAPAIAQELVAEDQDARPASRSAP